MKRFVRLMLFLALGAAAVPPVCAEEILSLDVVKKEAQRLGNEGAELVKAPFASGRALLGTAAATGAVTLAYLYDEEIREKLQGLTGNTLESSTDVGNIVGNPFLHLGVAAAVYGAGAAAGDPWWRETGEMLGEAALLADASGFLLKQAIGRERPFVSGRKGEFSPAQFREDRDSLPSLHTASSFAVASVISSRTESLPLRVAAYSAAGFVGFSRMHQDRHWASDVVLGAVLGELCGRVVASYHARGGKITLFPRLSADGAALLVSAPW